MTQRTSPRVRRLARLIVIVGALVAFVAAAWRAYRDRAGEPSALLHDRWHEGQRVLDRRGRDLRELPSEAGHRGRSLPLDALGDRIVLATLVSEDRAFFEHQGVDGAAILRALAQNLEHGRLVSGASTITQQLVKLLDHEGRPHPRTLGEKIKEAARAENLEAAVDKGAILEAYLNRLSYGHGLAGPEAAANGYFGVAARDLSWAQAAYLAVLPRAPSFLDPLAHGDRVALRQRALLDALRDHSLLTDADHARAMAEPIAARRPPRPFLAPHFVQMLVEEGSAAESGPTETTLDATLQRDVEGLTRTHLAALDGFAAQNAAVLVVDNKRGEVLAYMGSADFNDPMIAGQVDMVRARRQPGSTLKPFVYAMAFARGHTAAEMLADVPTAFAEQAGVYAPDNFDGTFEGPISAREALAGSLNVPVIRLAAELPEGALLASLRAMGFGSLDRDAAHYGLSLALGSGEVTLRELAGAYVALARGGSRVPLRSVAAAGGAPEGERVLDAGVAALLAETLSDPVARVRGLHGQGPFDLGFPVAVKTGTSSGFRDTWTVGFTRERTVAVWLGNAGGAPTRGLTGASGAGPLFADVMRRAMADVPARAPLWDASLLTAIAVCPLSGKLPGPACPEHAARHFMRGHPPTDTCDVHVTVRPAAAAPAPSGGARRAPFRCDAAGRAAAVALPEAFDAWLAARPDGAPGQDPFGLPWYPRHAIDGCAADMLRAPALRVDAPAPGSVFARGGDGAAIELAASFAGDPATAERLAAVEFVVDGVVAARSGHPFRASIPASPGDHEVVARPADPTLAVHPATSRFSVR